MKLIVFDVSGTLQPDIPFANMYDGMKDIIISLKNNGVMVALATNLSRSGLNTFINANDLSNYLDDNICLSEAKPKPHPEMLETLILKSAVDEKNVLMIGDSIYDIKMAHNAKVKACAITFNDKFSDTVLLEKPEFTAKNIIDLCYILSKFTNKKIIN